MKHTAGGDSHDDVSAERLKVPVGFHSTQQHFLHLPDLEVRLACS